MMKVWTVSNQKGGVGKTTTVVTLAGLLSMHGRRTLCIDLDPHGSLTSYFRLDPDTVDKGVYNLFMDSAGHNELNPLAYVHDTQFDHLALLPASTALATLDRQASKLSGAGLVIGNSLRKLSGHYDHVIIDSPPMLGVLMVNALAACQRLIIPVQTEFLALKGLERMLRTLEMMQKSRQEPIPYTIVPTMFDVRTRASTTTLNALRDRYHHHLWDGFIPVDTQLRESSRVGVPAPLLSPRTRAVKAYAELLHTLNRQKAKLTLVSSR